MKTNMQALILIGSPKAQKSTSESLGAYLSARLQERGVQTGKIHIYEVLKSGDKQGDLLSAVDASDILLLIFPLYVDSLPSRTIRALELIAEHRKNLAPPKKLQFLAITNCGFPEALHTDTALAICRRFAVETGMEWLGGLGLGMGGFVGAKPLEKLGFMARNIRKALNLTAEALAAGERIPQQAVELMAKRVMPPWLYIWFGNMGWRHQAKKNEALMKIKDQAYKG